MHKATLPLALIAVLSLAGCGAGTASTGTSDSKASGSEAVEEARKAPDLTGEWTQSNSKSEDSYQQATITADTMTVEWVADGGETRSIYWVGTFEAPTDATEPYTWTSTKDAEATASALLASSEDTKQFTFEGDTISYELSALGTTMTVKLAK